MNKQTWNAKDPWIFTRKVAFMQRIADRVRAGFTDYISGKTELKKVSSLTEKFSDRYTMNLPKVAKFRKKEEGKSSYYWAGYVDKERKIIYWILLCQSGEDKDTKEIWKDAREEKITLTGYELVRVTKQGASKPAWTWRYTRENYDKIRNELVSSIRNRHDAVLKQIIHTVWRSPGFSGVRVQVKKTRVLILSEWKRTRSKAEEIPEIPKQIGFVRRLKDVGDYLSNIVKGVNDNEYFSKEKRDD